MNLELQKLFQADQDDRRGASNFTPQQLKELEAADARRSERVAEIVRRGELETAEDFYHAAMMLQHGANPEDYLSAHVLATIGVFKGREEGKWLSAATLDRFLLSIGRPQIFGTQYRRTPENPAVTQEPYDRSLNDLFRKEYNIPSLLEQEKDVARINADDFLSS
jgi:hypothetical protein